MSHHGCEPFARAFDLGPVSVSAGPRERLQRDGEAALRDEELVALLLRTGSRDCEVSQLARELLTHFGGLIQLSAAPEAALLAVPGLGPAKAASLRAAWEIGRRLASTPLERGRTIRRPLDIQRFFGPRLRDWRQETFQALLLDGRHRLMAIEAISLGTLTASLVHPREVFRPAIARAAAAIVVVHNHPSGDPSPSAEDRQVTRRLCAAGELIGIRVLDHVIVAESGYFSFCEDDPTFAETSEARQASRASESANASKASSRGGAL